MNCEKVSSLISAYIDREVSEEEERKIRHHLGLCPDCHKIYSDFDKVKSYLDALPSAELPPYFWSQTRSLLRDGSVKPKPWAKFLLTTAVTACISLYAAVGGLAPSNFSKVMINGHYAGNNPLTLNANTANDFNFGQNPDIDSDPFPESFNLIEASQRLSPRSTLVNFDH